MELVKRHSISKKHKDTKSESNTNDLIVKQFYADGTTCNSCSEIIKRTAKKIDGVKDADFSYESEGGWVEFDPKQTSVKEIFKAIESRGYSCKTVSETEKEETIDPNRNKTIEWILMAIGVLIVGYFVINMMGSINLPKITQNMSLGLLFVVGLLTGFHCIGMCGPFVVSYTTADAKAKRKSYKSHFKYGVGKTISYTIIGAAFGLLGSIVAFTPQIRGFAGIIAGSFLIIYGLKMFDVFKGLRKFGIKMPVGVFSFVGNQTKKTNSPLVIGLLNGLMIACGPLQAIYIMAAGTGSMIEGAKLLFVFGLGTLPVLLGFGFITSFLSNKATHKILKVSGAIVIVLGAIMLNNGLALTGSGYDFNSLTTQMALKTTGGSASKELVELEDGYQIIRMEVTRYGWSPDRFVLKKDVPVKWIIDGKEITGCNNAIQVPEYNLNFPIKQGEQIIEFTPTKEGVIPWSCWMGMIPGTFIVTDDVEGTDSADVQQAVDTVAQTRPSGSCGGGSTCGSAGSCGGGCGGGCGA